jgi:hypothetical protein
VFLGGRRGWLAGAGAKALLKVKAKLGQAWLPGKLEVSLLFWTGQFLLFKRYDTTTRAARLGNIGRCIDR